MGLGEPASPAFPRNRSACVRGPGIPEGQCLSRAGALATAVTLLGRGSNWVRGRGLLGGGRWSGGGGFGELDLDFLFFI